MASSSSGAIPTCLSCWGKKKTVVNVTIIAIVQIKTPNNNKSKHSCTTQQSNRTPINTAYFAANPKKKTLRRKTLLLNSKFIYCPNKETKITRRSPDWGWNLFHQHPQQPAEDRLVRSPKGTGIETMRLLRWKKRIGCGGAGLVASDLLTCASFWRCCYSPSWRGVNGG